MSNLVGTTWVFNDVVTLPATSSQNIDIGSINNVVLECGDIQTYVFMPYTNMIMCCTDASQTNFDVVYDGSMQIWNDNSYKTITFINEPDYFLPNEETAIAWLEANATCVSDLRYIVTYAQFKAIADAIRSKTGETDPLEFPTDFVGEITNIPVLDTSDATATASDIANSKTAYVNGEKVTGTHTPGITYGTLSTRTVEKSSSTPFMISTGTQTLIQIGNENSGCPQNVTKIQINGVNQRLTDFSTSFIRSDGKWYVGVKSNTGSSISVPVSGSSARLAVVFMFQYFTLT